MSARYWQSSRTFAISVAFGLMTGFAMSATASTLYGNVAQPPEPVACDNAYNYCTISTPCGAWCFAYNDDPEAWCHCCTAKFAIQGETEIIGYAWVAGCQCESPQQPGPDDPYVYDCIEWL